MWSQMRLKRCLKRCLRGSQRHIFGDCGGAVIVMVEDKGVWWWERKRGEGMKEVSSRGGDEGV